MPVYIYGAELWKSPTKEVNYAYEGLGTNSEVFTQGDTITVSSGLTTAAGATGTVYGVIAKTATMAADNQTVAKVYPAYIPIDQDMEFLMGTNADLTATTSVGVIYKLTGTTGAVLVDVTSGAQTTTSRVVRCVKVDPLGLGGSGAGSGLRMGIFKFLKVEDSKELD